MKRLFYILLTLALSMGLSSCEDGIFDSEPQCRESQVVQSNGQTTDFSYDGGRIAEMRTTSSTGQILSHFAFTYNSDNRISESQLLTPDGNPNGPPEVIAYNQRGKWITATTTYPNGDILRYTAEYDSQNQMTTFASTNIRSGAATENYRITFTWQDGNSIRRIFESPTSRTETLYSFDLTKENKRRREQEKVSFLYTTISHNKNMVREISSRNLAPGSAGPTVTTYSYEYNDEGLPVRTTRVSTTAAGVTTTASTDHYYECS